MPSSQKKSAPTIIPRSQHNISRQAINPNALKVLYRLHQAGYSAYLVGGCVRDLLLGRQPKDFDIATNAYPEKVRQLFKNCRLIGKRFRLAHILFGREIIEVATFRTHHQNAEEQHGRSHQGMIVRDNVYGNIEDDIWRRDFSINALYYNIADFSVVDYTSGMQDIESKTLRIIGDPDQRFHEDPVRLLRAVRFMGKLQLNISPETEEPLTRLSYLLQNVSPARLFQEVLKFFQEGALFDTVNLLQKYHLFSQLFPATSALLNKTETKQLIEHALRNTDERLKINKTASPAFLFAVFLWHPVRNKTLEHQEKGLPEYVAFEQAILAILKEQTTRLAIPKQIQLTVRDICFLQYRMTQRQGSRPFRTLDHARFRASYDLLMLRSQAGEPVKELFDWWTQFYNSEPEQREKLIKMTVRASSSAKKRRRRKSKKTAKPTTPPTT